MLTSYLPLFTKAGGVLYSDCLVQKVIVKGGHAVGVDGVFIDPTTRSKGRKIKVRSKVTVVCGGAVQSPALLMRSKVRDDGKQLGKNLLVHPNVKVLAVFDEEVRGWNGVIQGFQITEFFDEGILMAVNFTPPGIVSIALPLMGDEIMQILKNEFHHMVLGGALIEDTSSGRVVCGPFGTALPIYNLNAHDFRQAIRGTALLAEVFFSAGAKKCYLPFANFPEIRSIDDIPRIYEQKIRPLDMEMLTVHVMGSCRMGIDPQRSVVNPSGEMHNVHGLYVADASVFPSSIGVNPQVTIMALATRTAEHIAENFSRY
jgi:choline dehydrogenase-like flavoprotein